MRNALILHGTQGSSRENWFHWLKKELEKRKFSVWLPDLPGSEEPDLERYNSYLLGSSKWKFDSESVIVGHSSGAVAALALLNELPGGTKISKVVLVSIFEKDSPGGKWEPNKNLFDYKLNIDKIKRKADKFILIISDNDPYCPVGYVRKLSKKLSGEMILTKGDGHFSGDKYKKLPILLKYLI